ncbi:unconventional prefoldin RPB5 interactor [Lycorma delicatula]|uniref:unconventional prefoldin RPB5 interactor n=1 Tax=Lycorma delicatula TaxID=130591 RepID=UPI003F5194C1
MENITKSSKEHFFQSTYDEALLQNEIFTARWRNFKEEHEALNSRLLSMQNKLKHDIMVPIGRLALMKGKLVHTNEILVSLGDGWFTKQSSTEAVELSKRRIKGCDEMLKKLRNEKDLLISRKSFPVEHDLFSTNEIIEPYDEIAEAEWREKHRQRVKAYKQIEAKRMQKHRIEDVKHISALLDSLELQEEAEDELNKCLELPNEAEDNLNRFNYNNEDLEGDEAEDSYDSDERDNYEDENDDETADDVENKNDEDYEENGDINYRKKYNTNSSEQLLPKTEISFSENKNESDTKVVLPNCKISKVSFADETTVNGCDEEKIEPVCIKFKHSKTSTETKLNKSESSQKVNNPSDIYKSITQSLSGPKSILKKSISTPVDIHKKVFDEDKLFKQKEETDLENIRRKRSEPNPQFIAIGDVTERSPVPSASQQSNIRPVSRFKAARKTKKCTS